MAQRAIVFNPAKGERSELEAALGLDGEGSDLTWYETGEDDGGVAAVAQALSDGAEIVFAAGGDGTVRVVAEGLAGQDADMAILPQGTGNLLARNLDVPLGKPGEAYEFALAAQTRPIDVAWVEIVEGDKPGRYAFAVMAGLGVDAHLMNETKDDLKEKAGWLAYVEAMGRALNDANVVDATISFNGAAPVETPAHTIMIGNCGMIQGGITIFPDAAPDDGSLDVLILNADSAAGWLDTLKTMVWDNGIARLWNHGSPDSDTTRFEKASELDIRLSEPVRFQIDGDEMGEVSHLTVTVEPQALRVRW